MIRQRNYLRLMAIALLVVAVGALAAVIHRATLKQVDYAMIESGQVEVRPMGDTLQEYYEEYGDGFAQVSNLLRQSDLVILGSPSSVYQLLPTTVDREVRVTRTFKGEAPAEMIHVIEPSFLWFYTDGGFSGRAVMGYCPMQAEKTYILFLRQEREQVYTITNMAFGKYPAEATAEETPIDWAQQPTYGQVRDKLLLSSDPALLEAYARMHEDVLELLRGQGGKISM